MKKFLLLFLSLCGQCFGLTTYYFDPDWTGAHSGLPTQPWSTLDTSAWSTINTALTNGDVTIYFSALKADGVTQQSVARFIQSRRTDYSSNRLTLDGYSYYNSNETTPNWLANPDTSILHAYLNQKVLKTTGDGSQALGWNRNDGNDFVINNGLSYCCIESHLASSDKEPGVGVNWQLYWDQHGTSTTAWSSGTKYKCYPKQNNVTIRGFELTGSGARAGATGDNLIFEYVYIHDLTGIGPGLQILYTSFPDSSAAQIISRPSTNMTFRNFRIERTYGEGFYIGSINPDSPAAFQLAHGNQHSHILIENFKIDTPGTNGGQGDGVDCKNGITYLTIRLGEIVHNGHNGNGINLPMTATNVDQHNLVERNFIHDCLQDGSGAQFGIYAAADQATASSLYGYNGTTIRNNIVANMRRGIQYTGDITIPRPAINGYIFNNTIYNTTPDAAIAIGGWNTSTGCVVENNFVFAITGDPCGSIDPVGITSDYNGLNCLHGWISNSEGAHTITMTDPQALASVVDAANENFHLVAASTPIAAATPQTSFSNDYDGNTRGGSWDIGAFQFLSATPSPTPTASPTATATATATATPTASPSPTATFTPTPTPAATPFTPTGIKVVNPTTVKWTANVITDQVTSYNIYRYKNGVNTSVGSTTPPTVSFDVSSFIEGKRSQFNVTAVNLFGESLHSAKVTVQKR